jgi:soluble lytic murein transglycosylase-like protein
MIQGLTDVMERISEIQSRIGSLNSFAQPPQAASQTGADFQSLVDNGLKDISGIIERKAQKFAMDSDLIRSIIQVESNGNPTAVSPKGAKGLMQLMPQTAEELGVRDVFNEEENVEGGVKYLKGLLEKYKDLPTALAAYNAGPGEVDRNKGIPDFKETKDYVNKVLEMYNSLKEKR